MTSVRSPPLPLVPVSRARSAVPGASLEHLLQALHRAAADAEPIRLECRADGGHPEPILSDVALISDGLLPAWQQALTHRDGPLLVVGPAGCGKTSLIEARFLWLTEQGVRPEQMVVLTPSAARADALRARLEQRLDGGYEQLHAIAPAGLARLVLRRATGGAELAETTLSAGDRLALLVERVDELPLTHHDIGGSVGALLGGFIRTIDRLKAELVTSEDYASLGGGPP